MRSGVTATAGVVIGSKLGRRGRVSGTPDRTDIDRHLAGSSLGRNLMLGRGQSLLSTLPDRSDDVGDDDSGPVADVGGDRVEQIDVADVHFARLAAQLA